MTRTIATIASGALSLALLVGPTACGSSESAAPPASDGGVDATADATPDTTADAAAEASPDAPADVAPEATPDAPADGGGGTGLYVGRVVGVDGLAGYDALSTADKNALKGTKVAFFHASVGGNVLSGADSLGFSFASVSKGSDFATATLGEHDYGGLNGDAVGKLDEYARLVGAQGIGKSARLIGAKLCWVDFDSGTNLTSLESKYASTMSTLRAGSPSARFFHVTPPLKTSADASVNGKRLQFGQWMSSTYGGDAVVLDLAAVESTDTAGAACMAGGARALCAAYASDDGHLNATGEARAAKAFLYALHVARTAAAK